MAGLQIHRVEDSETITLRLEGRIDARTAAQLRRSLDELGDKPVVIDFSQVREFLDVAVAVLSLEGHGRSVQLKGLVGHQERMFRYFGFPTPDRPRREYYTPEPQLLAS